MKYILRSQQEPEGTVSHNLQNYRFKDVAPRLADADGFAQLYVAPLSIQSELMVEANHLVGAAMDRRLHEQGKNAADPIERLDLTTAIHELGEINTRLRGRVPYSPQEIKKIRRTPSQMLGQISIGRRFLSGLNTLGWETTSSPPNPFAAEAHFVGHKALTVIDNLQLAGKELKRQAQTAHFAQVEADRSHQQQAAIMYGDQANVLMSKAEGMIALHDELFANLSPAPNSLDVV